MGTEAVKGLARRAGWAARSGPGSRGGAKRPPARAPLVGGVVGGEGLHHPAAEFVRIPVVQVPGALSELDLVEEVLGCLGRVRRAAEHAEQRQVVEVGEVLL